MGDEVIQSDFTFAMIKPDMFEGKSVGCVLANLEALGFEIVDAKIKTLTKNEASEFYIEHEGKDHFPRLVEFMSSGPVMGLLLKQRVNTDKYGSALALLRSELGSADPTTADKGSLRWRFGTELPRNAIHASDSYDALERECDIIFDRN